jgi:hypothetical protein
MNIRSYLSATALILTYSASVFAQDETDALRFSYLQPQGTARSMGIGGALGALGGDFTSLSINPAGIGVYRRSEVTFTPSLKMNNTQGTYLSTQMDDNSTRFTINNLGIVATSAQRGQRYERSSWKSTSFGFGINRLADFSHNYTYGGRMAINPFDNSSSSGAEVFSIDANRYPDDVNNSNASGTPAYMGYQSFLLDTAGGKYIPVTFNTNAVDQQRTVIQKGGISEMAISLGGNYEEKLMLGATLGVPVVRYKREIIYTEKDASGNNNNDFESFEYSETLTTRGSGINLKLGAIYKPVDAIRIGAAIHTPTLMNLKDEFNKSLTASTENLKNTLGFGGSSTTRVDAPTNTYQYSLVTPWRGVISVAGILGKYGFISIDYEYVNYASARFYFEDADRSWQNDINSAIKNSYKGASNLRAGLEGRLDKVSLRVGFGYYGSPYKTSAVNGDRIELSAGVGFRTDSWFVDLGFVNSQSKMQEQPYTLDPSAPGYASVMVPTATLKNNFNNAALTFGVKF